MQAPSLQLHNIDRLNLRQGKHIRRFKQKHWIDFFHYMMVVRALPTLISI